MTAQELSHEVATPRFEKPAAAGREWRAVVTAELAAAGVVGPIWFTVLVLLQGLLHPTTATWRCRSAHWRRGQAAGSRT